MTDASSLSLVRLCAWGGPAFLVLLIVFWGLLGGNVPPFGSDVPAETIAAYLSEHALPVRIGMIMTAAAGPLYLVWGVAISAVMERIAPGEPILPRLQVWGAGFTTLVITIPACIWATAAFRPDTLMPETTLMLYDLGWMLFDLQWSLTSLQMLAMAACFLRDRRPAPIVPQWAGWFVAWVGCMLPILALISLFKSGPFARNGLINYWFEFPVFFLFMIVVCVLVFRAISRIEHDG